MSLINFLTQKGQHYTKFDLIAMKKAWEILRARIDLPYVIHIIGTNGKGSTGRFISHYLHAHNKKVVHYSSPHITTFHERIWIDGDVIGDIELEKHHHYLQNILSQEVLVALSYFEYTTLLCVLAASGYDYLVFEAGLGGEFDATSVVPRDLSVITTIDLDHQDFLGHTIADIAATKIRSCQNQAIIGWQIHPEVLTVARDCLGDDRLFLYDCTFEIPEFLDYPDYLKHNLRLACSVLQYLDYKIDFRLFGDLILRGRFERIAPNIIIDVGHNPLAARQIRQALGNQRVCLVYATYKDKAYEEILSILAPCIEVVLVVAIDDARMESCEKIIEVAQKLKIQAEIFTQFEDCKSYLIFGGFKVVEKFIPLF